ncbi:MAG: hypothetical protein ACRCW0_00270 [Clostridium sp.]
MEDRKWFKCPQCGGTIVKPVQDNAGKVGFYIDTGGMPTCKDCGKTYVIKINNDYSYEIADE